MSNETAAAAVPEQETKLSPEETELKWYKEVYRGDTMPQLTVRAVVMGAVLGGFMSLSNLYVGLKTGWGLGVAITACILSFAIYKTLMTLFPKMFPTEMSILENNCMQSTASSAGYSTGGTMVSAISAFLLVTGQHMHWGTLTLWTIFLAALGVFMAVPMKRQMINIEQLKFPSGIAAAETLRSLHAKGGDAVLKARLLGLGGLFGAVVAWLRDAAVPRFMSIPASLSFPGYIKGIELSKYTISFDMSAIMIAAGAIMGWKVAWSLLLGATINYAWLAPKIVELGGIDPALGYRNIVKWSTWAGASMMVTSALLAFAFQWRTILRAFSGITAIFTGKKNGEDPMAHIEVPGSWFVAGTALSGLGCILVLYFAFDTTLLMGLVAVVMTFFLSIVACRATGESDITPVGAMGKITQLGFGVLAPTNMVTNLMTASVTAGAAGASADLLTDLKSGYLLGANPRKQFLAQLAGIFAGTLVVVPAFYLLVPDATVLGSDKWPAPSAQVWAAVARLLSNGISSLHYTARGGLIVGGLIGIFLPLLEMALPKWRKFIPSAMGVGLALVIPFYNSLSMFIGAGFALVIEKKWEKELGPYVVPVSAGIIAGESIMGILVAVLAATGLLAMIGG
ncbi:MAG: OPT/YSL family transporter [Elusimicrobiaceae bacterium]|nr:OPT/YSL family transporter [Elusimicrobiaceae bacterium]